MSNRYFIAPDGADEPSLWERPPNPNIAMPALVLRKAELPGPYDELLWRVVTGVLAQDDATVERVADALIGNRPQLVALRLVPEGTRDIYRSDARAVLAALADPPEEPYEPDTTYLTEES